MRDNISYGGRRRGGMSEGLIREQFGDGDHLYGRCRVTLSFTLRRPADMSGIRRLTLGGTAHVGEIWRRKYTWAGYNLLTGRVVSAVTQAWCRELLERDIIETLRTSRIWPYEDEEARSRG